MYWSINIGSQLSNLISNSIVSLVKQKLLFIHFIIIFFVLIQSGAQKKHLEDSFTQFPEVTIGSQTWMQKNLDVRYFRNGGLIPEAKSADQWVRFGSAGIAAWCYYNFDSAMGNIYGKLYNWYAVNSTRGLAPAGWRIPNKEDWEILTNHLGGEGVAGSSLKATNYWKSPNEGATNKSGFSAIPGGYVSSSGSFGALLENGYWWSTTEYKTEIAWSVGLANSDTYLLSNRNPMLFGLSVRCIKD